MSNTNPDRVFSNYSSAPRLTAIAVVAALCCQVQQAKAQGGVSAGDARTFSFVPRVTLSETLTDNVLLNDANRQSEQITDISAGLRFTSQSVRLKAYVDYALHQLVYAQNTSDRGWQNSLNAFGSLEAVEGWAFVDFSGTISRQAISALGTQSVSNAVPNNNLTETSTLRLSPYLQGRIGNFASYLARYAVTSTRSKSSAAPDPFAQDASLSIASAGGSRLFGWSIDSTRKVIDYNSGRDSEADSVRAALTYAPDAQLRFTLNGGTEANNYSSIDKESHSTSGWSADWSLSDRTKFSAARQQHSYGESHSFSFDHRTGRTVWRLSDSKSVSNGTGQQNAASRGSNYDLLFAQYASIEPDPIKRAELVDAFLQANGIDPNASVTSGFLAAAVTLQRSQQMSLILLGLRDTVTFSATRSENQRLDTISNATDDLANSNVIRQRGFNISVAHRLTPDTSLNLSWSQQATSGTVSLQDTSLRSVNMGLTTRFGAKTAATFSARRVVFSSTVTPYSETAITGNLNLQF